MSNRNNAGPYSITSSARASTVVGMSMPSEGEAGLPARGSLHWPSQMFLTLASSDLAQARAHDGRRQRRRDGGERTEQGLSVHGAAAERRGSINNTTGPAVTRPGRVTAFAEKRRSNDTKAAGRHLSPRSGDAGQDARCGPVHEIPKHLVVHPRSDRPAAEARGRAAVGVVGPST